MRICRFDDNRLGIVVGQQVRDVTPALAAIGPLEWPLAPGDALIARLDAIIARARALAKDAPARPLAEVRLLSPVANPSKIIGAPINYQKHIDEAKVDKVLGQTHALTHISDVGLFLKANSSLVGPGEGVALRFEERRNDHELELAVVIGRRGSGIAEAHAFDYVAGYALALDMTVRGREDRSFRKSIDTYSVLGPWLVTRDEVADPSNLDFRLSVNGEVRQASNTRHLIYGIAKLIAYASSFYTLHPGDIIMTGTPEGVAPVVPGDIMRCEIDGVGAMEVAVRSA